jgi:hypothetical protein
MHHHPASAGSPADLPASPAAPADPAAAFPPDLVSAQRAWYATYRELARAEGTQTTVLRRRLVRLSVLVAAHPYWTTVPHDAPAARMRLKSLTWDTPEAGER